MRISKLGSATVVIETKNNKILCDPWLTDGAYYGTWCNYPPINMKQYNLKNIDYIYISHIHPDHLDPKTMQILDTSTPVLIHKYHRNFLRKNIERLGFKVIEIENGIPFSIGNNESITIFAADNCDPTICGYMFGCVNKDINGSMQLDSLCVIKDNNFTLVNTNDCQFGIAEKTLLKIKQNFKKIDFLLVGYTSASLYPHCMMGYTESEMQLGKKRARNRGLTSALKTLQTLKPRYYMPFAGTYIIGGYNYEKNKNLSIPEIEDAVFFLDSELKKSSENINSILLNYGQHFDLSTQAQSKPYEPINKNDRNEYIKKIASKFKYPFEKDEYPKNKELIKLFKKSVERLKRKQVELGMIEDVNLIFDLNDGFYAVINLLNTQLKIKSKISDIVNFQRFKVDSRLLKRVLEGPHQANWNNIEIGAHLKFARNPDILRQDIHILINSLHV
jgi:UDP-MurNAc hydroxylase